jgi:hypothetical protein
MSARDPIRVTRRVVAYAPDCPCPACVPPHPSAPRSRPGPAMLLAGLIGLVLFVRSAGWPIGCLVGLG